MSSSSSARVLLKPRHALPFFSHHPWVFSGAIKQVEGDPQPGDAVQLVTHSDEFVAWGLWNPHSKIRVRLYSWDIEQRLDENFWREQIRRSIARRQQLFDFNLAELACRLIFSEADGLSGLTVDRYGDWLIVQLTSLAMAERRQLLVQILQQELQPQGIWLRTEKGIADAEGLKIQDGLLAGTEPPRPLFVEENGIRFGVDLQQGQKTGFFLDQRENRAALGRALQADPTTERPRVLDLFSYSGGFGLAAAVTGQGREVICVDSSETALQLAKANSELNSVADRFQFRPQKVFTALEELIAENQQFDAVVLDPPKMTRSRAGLKNALRGYHSLNAMSLQVLRPGGLFVTCSCSGLISLRDFEQMLAGVALQEQRHLSILETRGAAADHPISLHCPETHYLKVIFARAD